MAELKIHAHARGFSLTPALHTFVCERVKTTLSHRADAVLRVDVHVGDVEVAS